MLISWSGNVVTSTDEAIDQIEKTKSSVMADVRWLSPINLYWGDNTVFLILIFIFGYWFLWLLVFNGVWLQLANSPFWNCIGGQDSSFFFIVGLHGYHSVQLQLAYSLRWNCTGRQEMSWSISYYSFKWVSQATTAVTAEGGGSCWDVDNQLAEEIATS